MARRKIEGYGQRLREAREAAGLSQADLGKQIELAGSQINKLETGVNQPTLATAAAIADALGLPVTHFIPKDEAGNAPQPGRPPKALPAPPPAEDLIATRKKGRTQQGLAPASFEPETIPQTEAKKPRKRGKGK